MKKLLLSLCLLLGLVAFSTSAYASSTPAPAPQVQTLQQKDETPDVIIVIMNSDGTIKEIIVIKKAQK